MLHYSEDLRLGTPHERVVFMISARMEAYRQQCRGNLMTGLVNAQSCGIKEFEACAKTHRPG